MSLCKVFIANVGGIIFNQFTLHHTSTECVCVLPVFKFIRGSVKLKVDSKECEMNKPVICKMELFLWNVELMQFHCSCKVQSGRDFSLYFQELKSMEDPGNFLTCLKKLRSILSAQNKNFRCDGQLIVTAPIWAIKLPYTAVTILPFCFCLFAIVRVCLHQNKKIQKSNFFKIYQATLIQWDSCFAVKLVPLGSISYLHPVLYCHQKTA